MPHPYLLSGTSEGGGSGAGTTISLALHALDAASFTSLHILAEKVDGVITPFALSTGGCGGGNATSIRLSGGKGLSTCFSGTGTLGISLPNTYYISAGYISAGNQLTTWWGGARAEFVVAGASKTLTSNLNVDTVVRGS
jgi:hypothetical protein